MGKKVCKVSKKERKNQFQSLIKVLKPKVYITDSSNFMKLVQELTGDGNSHTSSPSVMEREVLSEQQLLQPHMHSDLGFYDQRENQYDQYQYEYEYECQFQSISTSSSTEAETPLVNIAFDHQSCSVEVSDHTIDHAYADSPAVSSYSNTCSTTTADHEEYYDFSSLQFCGLANSSMSKEMEDLLAYQEIEAFLLDNLDTSSSFHNCHAQAFEQEVSIYDYELTGLTSS